MEVLTLQVGFFANHVGSHFWNFQDELSERGSGAREDSEGSAELDFSRIYSERLKRGHSEWQPRLMLVDKRGALGVGRYSSVEAERPEDIVPGGFFKLESHDLDALEPHAFQQDLEEDEREKSATWARMDWSDEYHGNRGGDDTDIKIDDADDFRDKPYEGDTKDGSQPVDSCMKAFGFRSAAEYNFASTTRTWTDYLKVRVLTSHVHELRSFHHNVSSFLTYFDGYELRGREEEEDILDKIRRQMELCDQLDAVHLCHDMHDGFAGIASLVSEWLSEEQPKCGKLVLGFIPPEAAESPIIGISSLADQTSVASLDFEACAWLSSAFSFASIAASSNVDAWIPVAVPLWSARSAGIQQPIGGQGSAYEASALVATALETASLPYRLSGGLRPTQLLSVLAPSGRPTCGLALALPLPPKTFSLAEAGVFSSYFMDLASIPPVASNPHASLVLRGAEPMRLLALCEALHPRAHRNCFTVPERLPLPLPFPQFFAPSVSTCGAVTCGVRGEGTTRAPGVEVEECPTGTHLHAAAGAGRCGAFQRMLNTLDARGRSSWAAAVRDKYGVEADDFKEVRNTIFDHMECGAGAIDEAGDSDSDAFSGDG